MIVKLNVHDSGGELKLPLHDCDPLIVCDEPFSVIDPALHVTEAPLWLTDEPGMEITPLELTGVAGSCEPLTACAMLPKLGLLQVMFAVPVDPEAEFDEFTVSVIGALIVQVALPKLPQLMLMLEL